MHHLVAATPWSDRVLLAAARNYALPCVKDLDPDWAWIVDDTGNPKKGRHSVDVAKQWCRMLEKQENCQVAVTLTVANQAASLPIAHRLYLPEGWANDPEKRKKAGIAEEITFQTKQQIAVGQIQDAIADGVPAGIVLADAAYGNHMAFRQVLTELKLVYAVGINGSTGVWREGEAPLPPSPPSGRLFPPLEKTTARSSRNLPYPKVSAHEALPVRPERYAESSITTIRIRLSRFLISQTPRCPFCRGPT
jgi:SRSO17 transposase